MNESAGINWGWVSFNTETALQKCSEQPNEMIEYLTVDFEKGCGGTLPTFKKVKIIMLELLRNGPEYPLIDNFKAVLIKNYPNKEKKITNIFVHETDTEEEEVSTQESQNFSDVEMTLKEAIEVNDCHKALYLLKNGESIDADLPIEFKNKLFLWLCKAEYSKEIAIYIRHLITLNADINCKGDTGLRRTKSNGALNHNIAETRSLPKIPMEIGLENKISKNNESNSALDHYIIGRGRLPVIFCSMDKDFLEKKKIELNYTPPDQLKNDIFFFFATPEGLIEFIEKQGSLEFLSENQIRGLVQFIKTYAKSDKNFIRHSTQIIYPRLSKEQRKKFSSYMGTKEKVLDPTFGIRLAVRSLKESISLKKNDSIKTSSILKDLQNPKTSFLKKVFILRYICNHYWKDCNLKILGEIVQKIQLEQTKLLMEIEKIEKKCKKEPKSYNTITIIHELKELWAKVNAINLYSYLSTIADKQNDEETKNPIEKELIISEESSNP